MILPHVYNGKDRTFFFFSYEGLTLRQDGTISTSVPTAAMREGDFSQLTNGQGQAIALYNPYTTQSAAQNYARTPYPGNIIPITQRSPFAAYYYSVLPLPTLPGVNPAEAPNWFGNDPTTQNDWTYTWRIDHRFSDRDQIFGRYTIGNDSDLYRNNNQAGPISMDQLWNDYSSDERAQTGSFTWNHIFGPNIFMQTVVTGADLNQHSGYLVPSYNQARHTQARRS